jgi:hypothetical protein
VRWLTHAAILFGLASLGGSPLRGQAAVTGTVRDDSTGQAVAHAEVLIEALGRRAETDARGRFALSGLPPGMRLMLVRRVGYHPVSLVLRLAPDDTSRVEITLERAIVHLAPLEVTEAPPRRPRGLGREAFEERRRMGFGEFIDSTVLRRHEHLQLPDLLRRYQGIYVRPTDSFGGGVAMSARRYCPMQVFLDGAILYRPGQGPPPDLKRLVDISSLEAVEIYRSVAGTPIEFGGHTAACGTLVLWTRRGP